MSKSELNKKYEAARKRFKNKAENKDNKTTTKSNTNLSKKYEAAKQRFAAKTVGFDTFESDLTSLNKTLGKVYNGWQTPETMKNTLSSVQSMYDRLGKYEEYTKQYGNSNLPNLTELRKTYKSVIDNWEGLSTEYGKYKNAEAYTNEKTKLTELYSMNSQQLKDKKGVAYTTSDGYNIKWEDLYNDAYSKEYESDIDKTVDIAKSGKYKKKDAKLSKTWNGYAVIGDEDAYLYNYVNGDKEARDYGTLTNVHMSGTYDFLKNKHLTEDEKKRFNALWETQSPEKAKEYLGMLDSDLRQRRVEHEKNITSQMAKESPVATSIVSVLDNLGNNALALPFMAMDYAEDGSIDTNSSLYTGRRRVQTQRSTIENDAIDSDIGKFFYRHGMNIADNLANRAVSLGMGSNIASTFLMGSGAAVDTALDAKERGLSDEQAIGLGVVAGAAEGFFESKGFESWIDSKKLSQSAWKYFTNNLKTELIGETLTEATNDIADYFIAQDLSKLNTEYQSHLASGLSNKEAFLKVVGSVASRYADVAAGTILSTGVMSGPSAIAGGIQNQYQTQNIGQNIRDNNRISDVFDMASNPEMASAYEAYTRYANKGVTTENISDAQLGSLWQKARVDTENIAHNKKSTGNQILFAKDDFAKLGDMAKYNHQENLKRTYTNAMNEKAKQNRKNESADSLIERALESAEGTEAHKLATELKEKIDSGKKLSKDETSKLAQAIKEGTVKSVAERLTEFGEGENASEVADIIARNISNEDITKEEFQKVLDSKYGIQVLNSYNEGVADYVKGMDAEESTIFLRHYDGETDLEEYANSFNLVSEYSKHPESFSVDKILENKGPLSTDAVKEIYANITKKVEDEASAKTNAELMARVRKGERGIIDESAINYGKEHVSGKVNWNNLDNRQKQAVIFAKGLYKALGSNLVFVGKNKKFNGMYNVTKDVTFLDVYAGKRTSDWAGTDSIITTISHELTHEMEAKSPELFKKLTDLAFEVLENSPRFKGMTKNDIIAAEIERLDIEHKEEGKHTEADAVSEIVARTCEDLLAQSKEAKEMVKSLSPSEQKTLSEKIKDLIQKVIDWIDEFLSSYVNQSKSEEAKALRENKEKLQEMLEVWDSMLRETQRFNNPSNETTTNGTEESTTAKEDKVRMMDRESESQKTFAEKTFGEQVDAVLSGEDTTSTHLQISEHTPKLLLDLGLTDKPMLITSVHTKTALGYKVKNKNAHNVSEEVLKNLPKLIETPAIAMESTKKGSIVMFVNAVDVNKTPVICSIKINGTGFYNNVEIESNVVTSVYGKDTNPIGFIESAVNDNRLLYWDKKMSQKLFDIPGLQLPDNIYNFDSNTIIRKIGENVNTENSNDKTKRMDRQEDIYDIMGETERLRKENEKFKEDFDRLKRRLALEKKITKGNHFNENQLGAVAGHLKNIGKSNIDKFELMKALRDVYSYIAHTDHLTWEEVFERCYNLASDMLKDSKQISRETRNTNISLSLKDASEVITNYNNEETTRWLANEIYNQYWNVSPIRTTADKYDKQIKLLNFEHRRAMKESRDAYKERLAEQKKTDRAKYTKLANEIRERRDRDVSRAKELGKKRIESFKENAARKTVLQSMTSTVMSLNKKLTTNSKDIHIPETLKPVVRNLLNAIDFSSKQLLGMSGTKKDARGLPTKSDMAIENALSKVHSMESGKADAVALKRAIQDALELFESAEKVLQSASDGTVDSSVVALGTDMIDSIKDMINHLDFLIEKGETTFVLQRMSTDHLKTLNEMVKSINHWAIVADKALANKHKKRISDLSMQTVEETDEFGIRQEYIKGIEDIKNFFNWSNLLPVNAFKRLGDAAMEFFDGLRDAQDKVTFNRQDVMDFTAELFKKYKQYKPKNWRTEAKTFEVKLPGEKETTKVTMPVSYVMTLYCVAKQEDAQRHLYGKDASGNKLTYTDEKGNVHDGGGMTIKGFKEGKFTLKVNKNLDNTIVNESIVKQITSVLTKEQMEVADSLQEYMNTKGSEWGDAVSMALYGIKKFSVENYFPITVSPHTLNADKIRDAKASLFSILNYGFTKERNPNAKQSIEIGDIFDVFANHMNMVAIYNAYALPIFDIARWYNFKGKTENGKEIAVTTSIEKAFGSGAVTYVNNLIKDLNGQHESSRLGFISKIFKNTKVAMVGNSISVALLQPTAYLKAMVKVPPKYLLKSALYVRDFGAKKGVEKAKKYCGIALLKSQGYFETGVSANTTTKMMHDESVGEKITEWSLKGAEWMDERTWGVLWNACEFEVRATRKDLKVGSEEFYEVIGEKLRDVIYETQVVDSPLTKSDLMRSPDSGAKIVTMFASEMTVAYNMIVESAYQTHLDSKKYGKKEALKKNAKNLSMTLMAYTLTSVLNAALSALVDSFRYGDDDEDENKFLKNFLSDWLIVGKIPYFKEVVSIAQGYSSSRTDTLWLQSAFKAIEYWGKDGKEMKALDESLKSFSYVSGFAVYNQWRELRALLRMIGVMEEE